MCGASTSIGPAAGLGFAAAGLAAGKFAVDAVGSAVTYQKKLNEVFTLLPGITQDAMGQMSDDLKQFDQQMGVTSSQSIPALYQALSAGVPAGNVFDFLKTAQEAAVGGVTTLETAVNGLSSVVNAYGSDVLSASKASDDMFTAVRLGKTTFDELSQALFNVVPTAAAAGVAFGDITSALAAMTAQGTPTNVATTQLRQLLVELTKDGSAAAATFEKIAGESFRQFIAQGGNLAEALNLMDVSAKGSGKSVSDLFSSVEAGQAALELTGKGAKTFADNIKQTGEDAGATGKAYEQMSTSAQQSINRINAAWENLKLEIGDQALPALAAFTEFGAENLPKVTQDIDDISQAFRNAADGVSPLVSAMQRVNDATDGRGWQILSKLLFDYNPLNPLLLPKAVNKVADQFRSEAQGTGGGAGGSFGPAAPVAPTVGSAASLLPTGENTVALQQMQAFAAALDLVYQKQRALAISQDLARVGSGLADMGDQGTQAADAVAEGLLRVGSGLLQYDQGILKSTALSLEGAQALERVGSGLNDVQVQALSWAGVQSLVDQNISNANGAYDIWTQKLDGAQKALDLLNQKQKDGQPLSATELQQKQELTAAVARYKGGVEDQTGAVIDAQVKAYEFTKTQDELNQKLKDHSITQKEYNQAILDAAANADPATAAAYGLSAAQKDTATAISEVVLQIQHLLQQLGLIPPDTTMRVTADTAKADENLARVGGAELPDKNVMVTAETTQAEDGLGRVGGWALPDRLFSVNADTENAEEGLGRVGDWALPDKTVTVDGDTADADGKLVNVQQTIAGIPRSFTITAYANTAPAVNSIIGLGKLVPQSPAEEGPFSKEPNWGWVFEGSRLRQEESTKDAADTPDGVSQTWKPAAM